MKKSVYVLGTKYSILYLSQAQDSQLECCNGYCDWTLRKIVVRKCVPETDSLGDLNAFMAKTLRHEIVHAFFLESGLHNSSGSVSAWASNEEMVDWFARQGPKIYAAWQEAGAL